MSTSASASTRVCSTASACALIESYDDGRHYQSIWNPLVQLEAKYDQSMKSDLQKGGIDVHWDVGLNKKHLVYFTLPIAHDEFKARVNLLSDLDSYENML